METSILFTPEEKNELVTLYKQLIVSAGDSVDKKSIEKVKGFLIQATQSDSLRRNVFGHESYHL
jgi:guanosine-3',5'-bis(diphosphate) 3'-pyrophosphohydrolase